MTLHFRTIDMETDLQTCLQFRKDSFRVSFAGDISTFHEDEYINHLRQRIRLFPWGYVMVEEDSRVIGQMELFIRDYEGRDIGFVSLYYLIPESRRKGYGRQLTHYAERRFREQGVSEYHLRVSPTNAHALHFYQNQGLVKIKEEEGTHPVWRMSKQLNPPTV
jgi:ribosomal protein S18 acetylase RimI-like enzyme